MKTLKTIIILVLWIVSVQNIFSQLNNPFGYTCSDEINSPQLLQPLIGGQFKPESVDKYTNQSDAVFPVLVVFVQFKNDQGPEVDYWPRNSTNGPSFINDVIAVSKNTNFGNSWWDAYNENTQSLSDFWMEASRGHQHITGQAVSVILEHEFTYYQTTNGGHGIGQINDDIYAKLQSYGSTINWPLFDKWSGSGGNFTYGSGDGYVDMMYIVYRSHNPGVGMPAGGIACLYPSYSQGEDFLIYDQNGQQIFVHGVDSYVDHIGSGLIMSPGHGNAENDPDYFRYQPINKLGTISFSEHEHGHYLFGGGHMNYGKMSGAGADYGPDECLSPYESLILGYMSSNIVNFNNPSYTINDYSSRTSYTQGEIIEVPIGTNEFFLIANRMKESKYDVIMWGDTAHSDPYRVINPEYGKGLYIYHAHPYNSGYIYNASMDQECADGLYNWSLNRYENPDWNNEQLLPFYIKQSVARDNDNGGDYNTTLTNHDDKSLGHWFNIGKKHINLNEDGTDKIFTNLEEVWTSRGVQGDRWDPWKSEYNEVFSPYSSPSTKNWDDEATGVFIYYESSNSNTANLKIYKTGEGGWSEDEILEVTPPSRPMGLALTMSNCTDQKAFPVLTWNHNLEPDMATSSSPAYKRYLIYRAIEEVRKIPTEFMQIADVYIGINDQPSYVDSNAYAQCDVGGVPSYNYQLRYRIKAVDTYNDPSVFSDFVAIPVYLWQGGEGGDHFMINNNNNQPIDFSLSQNYPNPFNPTSQINFSIAYPTIVSLMVYNLLGEEVAVLVNNEYRESGIYSAVFDGTNLASGIYIYKLTAGKFSDVKKMVLIK